MLARNKNSFEEKLDRRIRKSSNIAASLVGLLFGATMYVIVAGRAFADGIFNNWFFTPEKIEAAYRYQEDYGARIRNPLRAKECLFGGPEFIAAYRGAEFAVPCRFITETTRHLKEMLDAGAARYLFPLDANHAHLGIPLATWERYKHLPADRVLSKLLSDPSLIALYHTAEHLEIPDAQSTINGAVKAWMDKRNVLGFFDGRPNKILTPDPRGYGVAMPDGYWPYSGVEFLASSMGELFIFVANKAITFDIGLEDDSVESLGISGSANQPNKLMRTNLQTPTGSGPLAGRLKKWEGR
jgi:hypothetical protein